MAFEFVVICAILRYVGFLCTKYWQRERDFGMNDRWLSMKKICIYLGISHDTASHWITKGMSVIKMDKHLYFKRLFIDKWIIANVTHKRASKG